MKHSGLCTFLLALCLLSQLASCSDLEGFDEPIAAIDPDASKSDIGRHQDSTINFADVAQASAKTAESIHDVGVSDEPQRQISPSMKRAPLNPANFVMEGCAAVLIIIYFVFLWKGMRTNNKIGEAWARKFACPGGLFDKNFSYRGPKDTGAVIMRESAHLFKFYASGRRYCQGLLAELQLLARQDAVSMLWNLISPSEDLVKIEVFMHEANMPPIVLAVATPKVARSMQNSDSCSDIAKFTKKISIGKEIFPSWPAEKMWVLAEHSSVFSELFADQKVQQLFSTTGPHAASLKLFRSLHFTSENSDGSHKQVLRFLFKLPPVGQMDALTRLMEIVPHFIDIVGTYKMSPEIKKRALDARTKVAEADEELRRKRVEALQQKKLEKAQEERAKLMRMAPEARQKAEEKIQRQMQKKAMKSKTVRC